jgi:hypothetical protein
VIERVGRHRLDDRQIIHDRRSVRNQIRRPRARLAVLLELELRPQELRVRIDERGAITLEQIGRRQRARKFFEHRLVVPHLEVARRAGHEEEDNRLRLAFEVAFARRHRIRRGSGRGQVGERSRAQTNTALLEEPAAGN